MKVIGRGGYLFTPPGGHNESARSFNLYLDSVQRGQIDCYVNRCEATLTVPSDATPGDHVVSTDGGSKLTLKVITR